MQEESDFLRGQMTALYDQIEKISAELETLRASNTIKQANIELLEAELVFFKNQFEDLRNSWDNAMINIGKMCGEDLTDEPRFKWASLAVSNVVSERDALLAEREAMMKQEPVADDKPDFIRQPFVPDSEVMQTEEGCFAFIGDCGRQKLIKVFSPNCAKEEAEEFRRYVIQKLNAHQLPAQQIPEGYAGVKVWIGDKTVVQVVTKELLERSSADELLRRFENARSMLSASQPKGDL